MPSKSKALRVLLAEDNPNDAELLLRELRRAGYAPDAKRVETEAEFLAGLDPQLDIILSDYAMPQFSGLRALELANERGLGIPFIIVSGTIGEETAVQAMRSGAADYLLKDRLARLGPAVEQALKEKRIRNERKQAEETLDRLRRHHELILNSAGEGIYGLDLDGSINFINPKAAEQLKWTVDDLLGKPAHATIHHTKSNGTKYRVEDCPVHAGLRAGGIQRVTNDVLWRKDGTSFRIDCVVAPSKDERGQIIGTIVTFKDVTEQFAAEARLKLHEQQYRLLFETNPSPMWIFETKELHILAVNEAAIKQYGYARDEFLTLTLKDLRSPEDAPGLTKSTTSPESSAHFGGQFRHIRKDRSIILVDIYSGPIVWEGKAARIVSAIDITDRKVAEERLHEQADMINRARDAIIIRDFDDQKVTFWNLGAERLYGWSASEAIGRPVRELIFADPTDYEAPYKLLVTTGEFRGELKQITKDGREVFVDGRSTIVRNPDGTPRSVLSINTDVTEQKKLETQLLRAQRLESIGTLASGVAHDLNNILTPILMCAEILRDDLGEKDQQSVSLIEDCARRGAGIVKQVLTFARGVEGERVTINPRHLIDEMIDIARKTFSKSIEIDSRYSEDLWSIMGDPTQLHQVLLNLSVNARDAMPNGGRLTVAALNFNVDENYASMTTGANPGRHVLFQVNDTGSGMSRATIDKIFDPFFTTKEVGKGTGLGLSTTLGIVKSHGGFISVYSEIGNGTTFKVFLPASQSEINSKESRMSPELINGNGELILIADDEPGILRMTKIILEKRNYRVVTANDGPEALALLAQQTEPIDLVLTDMSMPFLDGVGLVRAIKRMKPDTLFIASTGQGEETRVAELQSLGVHDFLTKPYDTEGLLKTLRAALTGMERKV